MKILPSGDLEVAPNEEINFKVTKSKKPYAASISDLIGATWEKTSRPDELTEMRIFRAPTTPQSKVFCTVTFDFASDAEGNFDPEDKYTVQVRGNPTEDTRSSIVTPPPPTSRAFIFVVRA